MSNDKKTLADVQPGGRVRLGDSLPPLPCTYYSAYSDGTEPLFNAQQMLDYARAALSAQPSPGGQDALRSFACEAVEYFRERADVVDGDYGSPSPNEEMKLLSEGEAALAARQPVGEPVSKKLMRLLRERAALPESVELSYQRDGDGTGRAWWDRRHAELEAQGYCLDFETDSGAEWYALRGIGDELRAPLAEYDAAPPAQAVDLPYSLDADPAGIRARVADVITGTLMVGAQGHTPPPAGHWAEPFWKAARADATAQALDLGQMPHGIRLVEIPRRNGLDPINVFVQDYELGRGRIVVTCYGQAWCGFWGAMGDRTVMQFVASCDADYVAGNMLSGRHEHVKKHERTYVERIATEVIAEFRALIGSQVVGK